MADAELAAAPPAVQETMVEAKLFGKWDFSDVEVRHPLILQSSEDVKIYETR